MSLITELIKKACAEAPDRAAYRSSGGEISRGELLRGAEEAARLLRRQGVSPVIVCGDKEPSVVISMLACLFAGRAYVPVRPDTPPARLRRTAELTGAGLALSERGISIEGVECLSQSDLPRFAGREEPDQPGDTAYIISTSGSTGDPKGVPISVGNLENFVRWILALEPLRDFENVCVFNQASFSFDLSVADLYYALCGGHTLVAADSDVLADPVRAFDALGQCAVAVMTPTFARLCLLYDRFRAEHLPLLRCIYFCGERLDAGTVRKLFAAFPGLEVINAYGPTEAASAVCAARITPETVRDTAVLPVGDAANFATEISVEDGEIVLRGKSVFGGYLGAPAGGSFRENGVNGFRTGDLGRIENGMLYCLGRRDRQIKYKGYRIEPEDIETNIARLDGVRGCAVIGKKNADGTVRLLKAFVETDADAQEIRAGLEKLLPGYMIPKSIIVIDELPVNANGKIDRRELEKL